MQSMCDQSANSQRGTNLIEYLFGNYMHCHQKYKATRCRAANKPQPAITCSKLIIETLEQRCEICSKLTIKRPK